jgi:HAE1 family hydrophobic/amphiphilic exporter-1
MKSLLRFCVQRPLGALAVYTGLCLAGALTWFRLPQELMPDLRFPRLTVFTTLPNASPEEVENLLTRPLEQSLGAVKNIRRVESSSKEQAGVVTLEFVWDTDMDAALLWTQEKLDLIQDALPLEAGKPLILRYNPFEKPVLLFSVTGPQTPAELSHLVETRLELALEKTPGVSAVLVTGARRREIRLDMDAQRLAAEKISLSDIATALKARNVSLSAGSAVEGLYEYPVTVAGSFASVEGIRQAVVRAARSEESRGAAPALLRLGDLGRVTDTFEEPTSHARYDGKDTLTLAVYKRAEAYPLRVAAALRRTLEETRRRLPKGMAITPIYDQSVAIREGISDVVGNVVFGGALAFFVLWIFLRDVPRAVIVGMTVPLALLLTILGMGQMGMTLNLLTLGGLALGVGMLMDAAVVVVENISRRLEGGQALADAVVEGGTEVGPGVFFSGLTVMAAFAPIPFSAVGVAQRVFTPISLTILLSQAVSLAAGFTLAPALLMVVIPRWKPGGTRGWPLLKSLKFLEKWGATLRAEGEKAGAFFDAALNWALRHRSRVLALTVGVTALNCGLFLLIPRETMPDVDQDQLLIRLTLPTGTRLSVTDQTTRRVEEVLAGRAEVAHRDAVVGSAQGGAQALGPHQAHIVVDLAPRVPDGRGGWKKRPPARRLIRLLAVELARLDLNGGRFTIEAQGGDVFSQLFGRGGGDVFVDVKGQNLAELKKQAAALAAALGRLPGVAKVTDSETVPSQQIRYQMDEDRLARDGLSVADVAETVLTAVHGTTPTLLRDAGREVPLRLRLRREDREQLSALSNLRISAPLDRSAHPLSEYGALEMSPGPAEIRRRDQARTITLALELSGRSVADIVPDITRLLSRGTPDGETTSELGSEWDETRAGFHSLLFGFTASIALVYIVLVAQFNVLWVPLLAMAAVPLALNGVVPALVLTGNSLNLMSGQGILMLGGIVVNNSLMVLEFILHGRSAGLSPEDAARRAARDRLRPIFMTAIANIAGLAPLALGIGKGAAMQAPMAITVIFGLITSTLLTLVVVPTLYVHTQRRWE